MQIKRIPGLQQNAYRYLLTKSLIFEISVIRAVRDCFFKHVFFSSRFVGVAKFVQSVVALNGRLLDQRS